MSEPILYEDLKGTLVWLGQHWARLRSKREAELNALHNDFENPEALAKCYVEPDCQRVNPADVDEDDPIACHRSPMWRYLANFLSTVNVARDGRNQLFVLADAGMGKTSLLVMLKLTALKRFWPDDLEFELLKIGPDTLTRVRAWKHKRRTVLLLDSLDEYREIWGAVPMYLQELLESTKQFRSVIITCRTQFFPDRAKEVDISDYVKVEGFRCPVEYLSPFSDEQVEEYLQKIYPNAAVHKLFSLFKRGDNARLRNARRILMPMRSLRCRPMLLRHVDDLVTKAKSDELTWDEYSIYDRLVQAWLEREQRAGSASSDRLLHACTAIALELTAQGKRVLDKDSFERLCLLHPEVRSVERVKIEGRSLLNTTNKGEFRFCHYSIQEFLLAKSMVGDSSLVPGDRHSSSTPTDQMTRFVDTWIERAPLSPGSCVREAPPRTVRELVEQARAWRHGLLLRGMFTGRVPVSFDPPAQGLTYPPPPMRTRPEAADDDSTSELVERSRKTAYVLDGALLQGMSFHSVAWERVNLRCVSLRNTSLRDAVLKQSTLFLCDLTQADLTNADLSDANLVNARLTETCLDGTKLLGADLSGASLSRVDLSTASVGASSVRPYRQTDFTGARMDNCILPKNVRGLSFKNAVLRDAIWRNVDVEGADFSGADLSGCDLAGVHNLSHEQRRQIEQKSAAVGLPPLPRVISKTPTGADLSDAALFLDFVAKKKEHGEPTEKVKFENFVSILDKQRSLLGEKYQIDEIAFSVGTKNGRVVVRAQRTGSSKRPAKS